MNTPSEISSRNAYLPLFYFNVFFACVSFSIIMPSLAPYLGRCGESDPTFLASVVAMYSIGEMIGSLAFGAMYNSAVRRDRLAGPKNTLVVVILTGVLGSLL